jgi:hypothetical protein
LKNCKDEKIFTVFFYNRENFFKILPIYLMKGEKANQKINRKEDKK